MIAIWFNNSFEIFIILKFKQWDNKFILILEIKKEIELNSKRSQRILNFFKK